MRMIMDNHLTYAEAVHALTAYAAASRIYTQVGGVTVVDLPPVEDSLLTKQAKETERTRLKRLTFSALMAEARTPATAVVGGSARG